MTESVDAHDGREIYCRKLGHELNFGYCRTTDGSAPCGRILDCWFERFDVRGFLAAHVPAEQLSRITTPAPPKLVSLVEMIEAARARAG